MKNKLLVLIIAVAAFLRFYRIREYLTFLGDEGRDVLVVKRMLLDGKFTLLGPITSVGSIYMGPVYYYLTAPFLWLAGFDPVGPAVMVVLFSLVTVYLIYKISAEFISPVAGLAAAATYAVSRLTIIYGRSSWNPNVVPFFAVLLIFSLLTAVIRKKYPYLLLVGFSLGILIQLHYVTLMFFPILAAVFLILRPKIPWKIYALTFAAFLLAYLPFLLFELRHDFVNFKGAWHFITENNSGSQAENFVPSFIETVSDVFIRVFWRPLVVSSAEMTKVFIIFLFGVLFYFRKTLLSRKEARPALTVILVWLVVGILSYGLYRGAVYDYYFGSLFAVPHLLFGIIFYLLWQRNAFGKIAASIVLGLLVIINIIHSPLAIEPNNMLKNTSDIASFVMEKAGNDPFNFALIADKNSDHAYRYFLELSGRKPVEIEAPQIDPQRNSVTGQLLVVCEEKVCQPLGHPLWEIAGFGRAQITGEWPVSTVKVFRLVPYTGGDL